MPVQALAKAPAGAAMKLKPIRIGLYDQYGGIMTSGWTRWLLEQYEFPFQVAYPATLDGGDLNARFDTLVFTDGAFRRATGGGAARWRPRRAGPREHPRRIPRLAGPDFRGQDHTAIEEVRGGGRHGGDHRGFNQHG